MGMFDYIVCKMPLPGTRASWELEGSVYQTKDTPEQYLTTYTIESDGTILGDEAESISGDIEFYKSNWAGCWGCVNYTSNGEDLESVTYVAKVDNGRVLSIEQTEYTREPAIVRLPETRMTDDELAAWRAKYAGPWIGRTIYVRYGGISNRKRGFYAEVFATDDRKMSVRVTLGDDDHKSGSLQTVGNRDWGRIVFIDEADADAYDAARQSEQAAELARFDEYAAKWAAKVSP